MEFKTRYIKFTDTLSIGKKVLRSIGMNPFPTNVPRDQRTVKTNFIFPIGLWNLRFCEFSFVIYLFLAIKNSLHFLDAGISLPCLICCMLSEFKITLIRRKRDGFDKIMNFLEEKFPNDKTQQDYYEIREVHRATRKLSFVLAIGFSMFVWSFNLFPLLGGITSTVFYRSNFTYPLPYPLWSPFRTDRMATYIAVNMYLCFGAFTVAQYYIGVDSLLFMIANQISMHFNYVSKRFRDYKTTGGKKDFEFLMSTIQYHDDVLRICNEVNVVFSDSMLLNFMAGGGIICLVAFRATLSNFSPDLVKLMIYLIAMTIQIFILCSFGDRMIRTSTAVSQAAFEHDWYNGDKSYKQAMIFLIQRAQKPALLTASYFSIVSYESFKGMLVSCWAKLASKDYTHFINRLPNKGGLPVYPYILLHVHIGLNFASASSIIASAINHHYYELASSRMYENYKH